MRLSLVLDLIYLVSEVLLTITRRRRSKTGEKQDKSTLNRGDNKDLRMEDSERICESAVAER
jgi:hypothetical protein